MHHIKHLDFRVSWTKWPRPILTTFTLKSLKLLLTFLSLHQHAKNQFIPSTHSWDTVNFRVLWPGWSHPSLTTPTPKFFDQFLIYVNLCQHVKNETILLICSGDMVGLMKESCNLIGWEHFGSYLRNKRFSNMRFVQEQSK